MNTSLWSVVLPYGDSSVTEAGGYVSIENNGRLTTQCTMPRAYRISGTFLMANNPYNNFKVVLRTNGVPIASEAKGIAIQFNVQTDPAGGGLTDQNVRIISIYDPQGDFTTPYMSASLKLGSWHTFVITDNGIDINLYFDGSYTPKVTAHSTFSVGNKVTFYNREGAGGGSSISANGITSLKNVIIASP